MDLLNQVVVWAAGNVGQLVLSLAVLVLLPIARRYAALLKDESIRRVAQAAILEVEERTSRHAGEVKIPGSVKLSRAVGKMLDRLPGIDAEEADRIVHEELPKVRAATADFGQATLRAALSAPPTP